ncbi:MAG: hypothetical protein U5L05_11185 [Rubrivivax sp.]|nr:hypothetical protein [Rubrivivax sp.]
MTMKTTWPRTVLGALALVAMCLPAARADFELKDAQGRSILLKDDGTWRYLGSAAAGAAASAPAKDQPQAELMLEQRLDVPGGCRFEFVLTNTLPYEIGSLVPQFTVYRANDVAYNAQTASFGRIRPGDQSRRSLRFGGIACAEIARLQVGGGDRCEMGDLNKFSEANGQCLARVRVLASSLLPFEKAR